MFRNLILIISSFFISFSFLSAQNCTQIPELSFQNPVQTSGNSYRFYNVLPGIDANISVANAVNASLYAIDLNNTGEAKAFQPQVSLLSQSSGGSVGYIDFNIEFVIASSSAPFNVNNWTVTAVDVDGDGDGGRLRECVGFTNYNTYTLESNSSLTLSNSSTSSMTVFEAQTSFNLPGITTNDSKHMVYMRYGGSSSFMIRALIVDDGGANPSSANDRMFAFYFDPCIINDFNVPNTLPVEFSYFNVTAQESGALLNWETLIEINNESFEIQKSIEGGEFENIGQVQGAGTSEGALQYSFFDANPREGKNIYRLKQVDFDGQFHYSQLREINFSYGETDFSYSVYPNPAQEYVKITHPHKDLKAWVKLLDTSGKEILMTSFDGGQIELDLRNLPAGTYHISLNSDKFKNQGRTLIIR